MRLILQIAIVALVLLGWQAGNAGHAKEQVADRQVSSSQSWSAARHQVVLAQHPRPCMNICLYSYCTVPALSAISETVLPVWSKSERTQPGPLAGYSDPLPDGLLRPPKM